MDVIDVIDMIDVIDVIDAIDMRQEPRILRHIGGGRYSET